MKTGSKTTKTVHDSLSAKNVSSTIDVLPTTSELVPSSNLGGLIYNIFRYYESIKILNKYSSSNSSTRFRRVE